MKRKVTRLLIAVLALYVLAAGADNVAAPTTSPRVFSMKASALRSLRERIASGKFDDPALEKLKSDAGKALKMEPVSVMQKSMLPASGDKHDYFSLARYWWPDPTKPNGLPYIRRDGEVNPEINQVPDGRHLNEVVTATNRLGLAYYLFQDERYAAQATRLLRVWFLDPATRMNPNMQHAQATRGRNTGRGSGLIDSRRFSNVVDTVGLLAGSKSWTQADQQRMQDWFKQYLKWLCESDNGRKESTAENNHGSYYDTQVSSIALFTGDSKLATKVLKNETTRIASQIQKDGGQPKELVRTRSLWYSTFNIAALFQLAQIGESANVDLWNFTTNDGRNLRKALDYLTPYVIGESKWPYKQIDEYRSDAILPIYLRAAAKYKVPEYESIAKKIHPGPIDDIDCLLASLSD